MSATALRALQTRFAAALCDAVPTGGRLRPGPASPDSLAALLAPGPRGRAGLKVYQQAYAARLVAALRDNHDILARALGDEGFDALGRAYLAAQPSTRPSIRWFGDGLARFMGRCLAEGSALVPHPALADLARLDWALRSAFDAADAATLDATALAALPAEAWPGLRLQLHPSVQALALQWAVAPAWQALRQHSGAGEPELPAPERHAHTLLVWRRGLDTRWRVLADDEAALLVAALAGEDFGTLCATAAALHDDPGPAVSLVVAVLQQWLADGLVAALRPAG